jgi:hypothetical protein
MDISVTKSLIPDGIGIDDTDEGGWTTVVMRSILLRLVESLSDAYGTEITIPFDMKLRIPAETDYPMLRSYIDLSLPNMDACGRGTVSNFIDGRRLQCYDIEDCIAHLFTAPYGYQLFWSPRLLVIMVHGYTTEEEVYNTCRVPLSLHISDMNNNDIHYELRGIVFGYTTIRNTEHAATLIRGRSNDGKEWEQIYDNHEVYENNLEVQEEWLYDDTESYLLGYAFERGLRWSEQNIGAEIVVFERIV